MDNVQDSSRMRNNRRISHNSGKYKNIVYLIWNISCKRKLLLIFSKLASIIVFLRISSCWSTTGRDVIPLSFDEQTVASDVISLFPSFQNQDCISENKLSISSNKVTCLHFQAYYNRPLSFCRSAVSKLWFSCINCLERYIVVPVYFSLNMKCKEPNWRCTKLYFKLFFKTTFLISKRYQCKSTACNLTRKQTLI